MMSNRYSLTPKKEFYLDIWVPKSIPRSIEDKEIVIESKYDERPDLLAYDLFGDSRLWWVFSLFNMDVLIDPIGDFKSGTTITVPAERTIEGLK